MLIFFFLKIVFNSHSKEKIPIDKWTILDSISAILNIVAVYFIVSMKEEYYIDSITKDLLDYYMIFVLSICWLRFFAYFLVVKIISRLLLTLIAMITDTLHFMFIVVSWIIIMASVFTTLYQNVNPDKYGFLALSARTLYSASLGNFDFEGMGDRELSHSLLLVLHLFVSSILLLNYLIAILSTTY